MINWLKKRLHRHRFDEYIYVANGLKWCYDVPHCRCGAVSIRTREE